MEGSNWRPAQAEPAPAPDGSTADWRSQLQPEARQRIVNKIMDTLKRHLPISAPEGVSELQKIAIRFEEKIYSAAANQSDYLRKISLKMLSMENKSQHTGPMNPNSTVINQNPADPASLGIPSQVNNQGQSVSTVNQSSTRQQLLPQNIQSNSSVVAQSPANLPSALSSITGLNQSNISSVSQSSSLQNMTVMSQNAANNSLGQVGTSDIYANAQRQMQGRQQQPQIITHQQHQSQNQMLYQHQLQQQLYKQKLQQMQPHVQQQQQQQSLLQTTPLQSSQPPLMQMTSSLQSGQSSIQQAQTGAIQSAVPPGLSQNHLSSVQQSASSLLQQHPQSVARQQQQPQTTMLQQTPSLQQQQQQQQQPPTSAPQHSNLAMQQQLIGQQTNISNVQTQLLGQQASVTDMQQSQRMSVQQNNILNMQQPQHLLNQQTMSLHQPQLLGSQNNISGLPQQQQQQQQMLGSLSNVSNMQPHQRPMHMLQQSKTAVQQQQQQNQQAPLAMLQPQGQQSQHQSSQQQLLSQFQSQPAQLQQQMVQQHSSSLQREMQQRIQGSGALLSQNAIEKQMVQSQIALPEVSSSTTLDSTAQSGHAGVTDLLEEIYQKIKSMKELYFTELNELYQKISLKLQQLQHDMPPSGKASEQVDKIRGFKLMLERTLQVLQFSKSNIHPGLKDKLLMYEKQIINILSTNKKRPSGQQIQHPSGSSQSMPQQQQSQVPPLQQDNYTNQQINLQGSTTSMQPSSMPSLQHGSVPLSSNFGVPAPQQNITNALQTGSTIDIVSGNSFTSLQQGAMASMQQAGLVSGQSPVNIPQQTNVNVMSNGSMNSLQNNVNSKQQSSGSIQQQHFKQQQDQQQQQLLQNQQIKQQFQQRHIQQQQQLLQQQQKQQLLQAQQPLQQQLQQQQKQQQTSQMPIPQMPQLHQTNEVNELKLRQTPGVKAGLYQQHYSTGQRHNYYQQMKSGAAFPISSPQNFQASSPQISHHSSPQIDQHNLLASQIKSGTPLQSANSPFAPSPSTPMAPSPIPGESEKQVSGVTSLPNAGHIGHQQATVPAPQPQSLAVATPGISASPLLAEFTSPDGNQTNLTNLVAGKTSATERPLERLIKVIQSSTPKALSSAVRDIGSVVSMMDRIAGSAPGNGSRAAVGEDLVAMTKCRLQARSFMSQDGSATTKKIKRDTSAMPLNNVSSTGSANDSFKQSYGLDTSELESTATSRVKQQKVEVNHALLEEIRDINQRLIVTVVNISEEDNDSVSAASEGEGTIVKCFFNAVALCPSLKSQFASEHMGPILPLRLLVPTNYPKCSPILMDKLLDEQRESDDLSVKARSRFITSLRGLSQPMSLGEMARTWDACARKVITEYAEQTGGGTFSSRYGAWENCVGA